MYTFQQLYETVQDEVGDSNSSTLVFIKRFINDGLKLFRSPLRRYYTRLEKTANLVANQQYYQMPEDANRISGVVVTVNGQNYPLRQVQSEDMWRRLNVVPANTINVPSHYFIRGKDEIGIYPIPTSNVTDGIQIYYEPKQVDMSQADYTTGTVTVTNGDATVTHSGTGFTQSMTGRYIQITNGDDGNWYRIASFTSTSSVELENYYQGIGGSGKTFIIGEVPDLPDEYHPSLIDYACGRYYKRKGDKQLANNYMADFNAAFIRCKQDYGNKTTGVVIDDMQNKIYNIFTIPPNTMT
jgi:hypothetical protein